MTENKSTRKKVSIREYSRMLGVDEKTVRKARDAGLLLDGIDPDTGKILPDKADAAWGHAYKVLKVRSGVSRRMVLDKMDQRPPIPSMDGFKEQEQEQEQRQWFEEEEIRTGGLLAAIGVSSNLSTQETMRRREIVALALDKKKLEEAEGTLVRRDAVEKSFFLLGSELKKALLDIPARIARDMMAVTNEVEGINLLTEEISQVLTIYGNLKENTFAPVNKL